MAARGRYNRHHEPSGDVYGVLEFLCAGAPATGHADFSHDWNTERMESVGRRDYFAPAVAGAGRDRGSVCVRMVLAFFVEHNRPATFGHPLWSWLADQKMVAMVLAGKMGGEVKRCMANQSNAAT